MLSLICRLILHKMRPTPRKLIKTFCAAVVFGLMLININVIFSSDGDDNFTNVDKQYLDSGLLFPPGGRTNISSTKKGDPGKHEVPIPVKVFLPTQKKFHHNLTAVPDNATLRDTLAFFNHQQRIMNVEKFGDTLDDDSIVVVVQVHNRVEYLRYLIDSLEKTKGANSLLLIFSHDIYLPEINSLIEKVTFCRVLQIYYPFSLQLYPTEFPGEHPNDCPRDIKKPEAIRKKCNNANYPDTYGHYREARVVQTKHHWFWKINQVFDHLYITQHFTGPILFIEEDHLLTEDSLHMLRLMNKLRQQSCTDCNIMTIGTYDKNPVYTGLSGKVDITHWQSSKHNMGMALTREIWIKIKACAKDFCYFDDYNWDWSLHLLGRICTPLKVMVARSPRIFHIGECGVHHKGKNCDPAARIQQISQLLSRNRQYLFPDSISISGYPKGGIKKPKPNGGWGDIRDREMCMRFAQEQR